MIMNEQQQMEVLKNYLQLKDYQVILIDKKLDIVSLKDLTNNRKFNLSYYDLIKRLRFYMYIY